MELKSFKEWKETHLTEITKKSYIVKWFDVDNGKFYINNEHYVIEFDDNICKNLVGFKFYRMIENKKVTSYIKSKEPSSVMYTIQKILEKYIKQHKPKVLAFLGDNNEPSRVKKYRKYTLALSTKFGYYWDEDTLADSQVYLLFKDVEHLDVECINNIKNKFS